MQPSTDWISVDSQPPPIDEWIMINPDPDQYEGWKFKINDLDGWLVRYDRITHWKPCD